MTWRDRLQVDRLQSSDRSDKISTSVTSVSTPRPSQQEQSDDSPTDAPEPETAAQLRARTLLNRTGVRKLQIDGVVTIGIWSDLDGPEIRAALRALGSGGLPIRFLDGAGIPMRYKIRRVSGEPVPANVLTEMERHWEEPWAARDRMMKEMEQDSKRSSWGAVESVSKLKDPELRPFRYRWNTCGARLDFREET